MTIEQLTGTPVDMPALGESIEEGTVTRWLKQPGDPVAVGEPLLEVATDKVDTEIPSPVAGVLAQILVDEDSVAAIGTALAIITEPAGTPEPVAAPATAPEQAPAPPVATPTTLPAPAGARLVKLPRIRRTIAQRMMESLQTSAQLTTVAEVDVTAIAKLRAEHKESFNKQTGVKLSFLPFFTKAAVTALAEHPVLNASLNPDVTEATYYDHCHLGMAVDSDKGLMVPVIRDAHTLTLTGLAQAIADKAARVRDSTVTPDELSGGTFTLTNTGSRGALFDTPIINQPQTGILGIGAVVERVVPTRHDGELGIGVRSMAYLSISYDHRIVDGADAARFLATVKNTLEHRFTAADLV